jgi:hypothetical protein
LKALDNKEFIKRSISKFGNKFSYVKTEYKNYLTKVVVTCQKHGDTEMYPHTHLMGLGCSSCSREQNGKSHKLSNDEFIKRANKIHGLKYDYSETHYQHSLVKVKIICPKHGPFRIKPSNHINNKQGCEICGSESTGSKQRIPLDKILKQIKNKKGSENFDFSLINYFKNKKEKVQVICKVHGKYSKSIEDILESKYFGCKGCRIKDDTFTKEIFVEKSKNKHKDKYVYDKVDYINAHTPIIVTCKKHGDFSVAPHIHMGKGGFCPKCTDYVSSYEMEIEEFIKKEIPAIDLETTYRKFKGIKEVDLLCESKKLAIEFDGLYWHSDLYKDKLYHLNKTNSLNKLGYRLIHIFEDEWIEKKNICKSMILNSLNGSSTKIYARKCIIKEITNNQAKDFLNENHIQGSCVSKYRLGLFEKDKLVSVMTFGKNRICLGSKNKESEFELLRFCSLKNTNVVGSASKLFNYFIKVNNPKKITSYCDRRWGIGKVYKILEFDLEKETIPNYFYVKGGKRYGRFKYRKDILVKKGYDKNKTEHEIMKELGYNRIYDCGCFKFVWKNKTCFD